MDTEKPADKSDINKRSRVETRSIITGKRKRSISPEEENPEFGSTGRLIKKRKTNVINEFIKNQRQIKITGVPFNTYVMSHYLPSTIWVQITNESGLKNKVLQTYINKPFPLDILPEEMAHNIRNTQARKFIEKEVLSKIPTTERTSERVVTEYENAIKNNGFVEMEVDTNYFDPVTNERETNWTAIVNLLTESIYKPRKAILRVPHKQAPNNQDIANILRNNIPTPEISSENDSDYDSESKSESEIAVINQNPSPQPPAISPQQQKTKFKILLHGLKNINPEVKIKGVKFNANDQTIDQSKFANEQLDIKKASISNNNVSISNINADDFNLSGKEIIDRFKQYGIGCSHEIGQIIKKTELLKFTSIFKISVVAYFLQNHRFNRNKEGKFVRSRPFVTDRVILIVSILFLKEEDKKTNELHGLLIKLIKGQQSGKYLGVDYEKINRKPKYKVNDEYILPIENLISTWVYDA